MEITSLGRIAEFSVGSGAPGHPGSWCLTFVTMALRIYHNPRCRKSREALALLATRGYEPEVILYLQDPLTRQDLEGLLAMLGITPRELIRREEELFKELAAQTQPDDEQCLQWMTEHPKLIQRPIVVRGSRAIVARPPERLLEIMD